MVFEAVILFPEPYIVMPRPNWKITTIRQRTHVMSSTIEAYFLKKSRSEVKKSESRGNALLDSSATENALL